MVLFRRWFLIWFALVLSGGQLFAATREERAYAAAVAAFHDKFYDRAATGLTQFLQTYRKSTNAPMAVLLLAQSEFYLGKHAAAISRLADPGNLASAKAIGLADRYVYWQAEAQFAAGDFAGAAETFMSLPKNFPDSSLGLAATVEAAAAFEKLGQWPQVDDLLGRTNGLFQRAAQLDPASETVANTVANGRLLQSESKCVQQDFRAAIQILNLLNPATLTPEQDWKRAHHLYLANLQLDDLDAALATTTNLLQIARHGEGDLWATNLAESVACHAEVLEKQGWLPDAFAAWQENFTNSAPVEQQQRAILKMAELAAAQTNLTDAEVALEKYLSQFPNGPAAELALLTLGELHFKGFLARRSATNELAAAQTNLDRFLTASPSGRLAGKAFLNRGWCHWEAADLAGDLGDTNAAAQSTAQSLADFQAAAQLLQLLPVSEDLAVARFKLGDAQFALKDFAGARASYQSVLDDFPALTNVVNSLGDRALYQVLRAHLALTNAPGADSAMRQMLAKFSTSALADSSRLLAGEGFSDFVSPAKARELFREFELQRADSPLLPQVAFAAARTFEREQNWVAAITNYQSWLKAYPTNELRPQVEYARNWAVAQSGDEGGAFALFSSFVHQFPTNALTPLAHWWVADHFFRLGGTNLVRAELSYELIFQDFPTNELAYKAQFMAGRAAMGRFSPDALGYFSKLFGPGSTCPDELKVQAKFGYCEALRQMTSSDTNNANLQLATNILGQLTPLAATNEAGALAWSEMGDCNLQLGALDAATNAYTEAFKAPTASWELFCRAKVGFGLVLEKKADGLPADAQKPLLELALKSYQDVFYAGGEKTDAFWKEKAGLQMLALARKTGLLKGDDLDDFIARLKTTFPQLHDSAELKRLAAKN